MTGASASAVLQAVLLAAAPVQPAPSEPSPSVVRWQGEISRVDGLLRRGAWGEAERGAAALVAELLADLKGGPAGARLLATAYAQRGLAEAGLERREDALWSLRIAGCLDPVFDGAQLDRIGAPFGAAGERLTSWRRAEADLRPTARPVDTPGLDPPALLESPTIVFRASAEVLRSFDRTLSVEIVVDAEGRPRAPAVRGSRANPSPVAASLETLRRWRFEPARLDGEAVPVFLSLDLPLTRGAAEGVREWLEDHRGGREP